MLQLFCADVLQVPRRGWHGIRRRQHLLPSHVRDGERFWTYPCHDIGLPNVELGGGIVAEHFSGVTACTSEPSALQSRAVALCVRVCSCVPGGVGRLTAGAIL